MGLTTVVFVHGFNSTPSTWKSCIDRLSADQDFPSDQFRFMPYGYPTSIAQLNPAKRIPSIKECGMGLADYIRLKCADAHTLFLVGHSMGGLVIEAMLAAKLADRAFELKKIRGVIQFATPNLGSNMLSDTRSIIAKITGVNPQEEGLRTLSDDTFDILSKIGSGILRATKIDKTHCPVAFQVFYGLQDAVVPRVSASGPFDEVGALPGDHNSIIDFRDDPDPRKSRDGDPDDLRYLALKDALLTPVGHPAVYEISLFEVILAIAPNARNLTFQIPDLDKPVSVTPDNTADRTIKVTFSEKNRCHKPYKQVYRSTNGFVEFRSVSAPNEANAVDQSTYRSEGKLYTYIFTPDGGDTFSMRLRIFNGFTDIENRCWHNHMDPYAHYKCFRITLDLREYEKAGYMLDPEPRFCYYIEDTGDHLLCDQREEGTPLPSLPSASPWLRTWELRDVQGGVVDLVWDVKAPSTETPSSLLASGVK